MFFKEERAVLLLLTLDLMHERPGWLAGHCGGFGLRCVRVTSGTRDNVHSLSAGGHLML